MTIPPELLLCATPIWSYRGTACVMWTKGLTDYGYGVTYPNGVRRRAHRVIYEKTRGAIPPGLVIDHLCRNRACVNPDHLEPVTNVENVMRGNSFGAKNARKTHCKRGHPYSDENTYRRDDGERRCRICHRELNLSLYHRKKPTETKDDQT